MSWSANLNLTFIETYGGKLVLSKMCYCANKAVNFILLDVVVWF